VRRRTKTSTILRPALLLHRGAQAWLLHRIVTVTLRPWRHHTVGLWGAHLIQFLNFLIAGLLLACAVALGWMIFFPV
jgi:hypothetical protein